MKRFIQGEDRSQSTLLPECLDDYIVGDNPVRVIEVFVNELDLGKLGFDGAKPQATGRRILQLPIAIVSWLPPWWIDTCRFSRE